MERREATHEAGDRYVLQYAGGVERLAQAQRVRTECLETTLNPIEAEHPLPAAALLAGEWLVGPRDHVIRDAHGCYWCVTSRLSDERRAAGEPGPRWIVQFERFCPDGSALRHTAASHQEPALMAETELVEILRQARDSDN